MKPHLVVNLGGDDCRDIVPSARTPTSVGAPLVSVQYLLPCPCGQQIVIEPRQAGEMVRCVCGASVQVPTLLEITSLEPAPSASVVEPVQSTWGLKQQLRLLGIMLLLVSCVGVVLLHVGRPVSRFDMIDPEQIRRIGKESLSVAVLGNLGDDEARFGPSHGPAIRGCRARFHVWQIVVAGTALVSVALIVASTLGGKRQGLG